MDTIIRKNLEIYSTTMSLSDNAWEALKVCATKTSISISELTVLCVKCKVHENQIREKSDRPTIIYNPEPCAVIKKVYMTKEEHNTVQTIRNILKTSVSYFASTAVIEYAERITSLIEKEKLSKNSWIIEKWMKRVEIELMSISRKILKVEPNLLEFGITMTRFKGNKINPEEFIQNLLKNKPPDIFSS